MAAAAGAAAVDVKALNAAEPKVKVALVTGGNKGIGLAVVKSVAKLGADKVHVILTARKEADGAAAVAECKALGLTNVSSALLDVDSDASVDALVTAVLSAHKRVDWLVNNAGVLPGWGTPVLDTKIADVEAAFHTNTLGPLKLSMKLVPQMKANGYGRVVNMSSGSGQLTHMNGKQIAYRLSKAGLNVVTRVFADELKGTNVAVNSMCPGFILTDMTKSMASPPSKTPEQGADTAVWLLQHDASGPNGGFFRNRAPIDW